MAHRVLITGGTGFYGAYLARQLLDRGDDVYLFDVKPLSEELRFVVGESDRLTVEIGGVENWPSLFNAVRRFQPDRIVHAAMILDPAFLAKNPITNLNVNFGGTIHALEATRIFEVERIVYLSSIGVLPAKQYEPIDGNHPIFLTRESKINNFYGAAKISGEAFCFAYMNIHGVDARIVRPSAIYGFGMSWPIVLKPMVEGAVRGERVHFEHGGSYPRVYTHVADVASLTVALLDGPVDADRIFYGATGLPPVTQGEVARVVRELVPGADVTIEEPMSEAEREEMAFRGELSIANARQQLGWEPRYAQIRDGVEEYIGRYRAFLARG
jgi:nucleoside-diphosphate-sugar epimerase